MAKQGNDTLEKLQALFGIQNTKTMEPPKRVIYRYAERWTLGDQSGEHRVMLRMVLVEEGSAGPVYEQDAVLENAGGPPAKWARPPTQRLQVAWFALPRMFAQGSLQVEN